MRYIRYASIAIFGVALVVIALANRQTTSIRLLPEGLEPYFAVTPGLDNVPVFLVIFGGIVAGLVVGFIWEWIREAGERAAAARQARELQHLRREVARLRGQTPEGRDEVLAILDEAS